MSQIHSLVVIDLLNIGFKVKYHANGNPLNIYEKNSICWSKVNISNNAKHNTLPCYFVFKYH